ncbi:hypothetical protein OAJ28_01970 [Flavobacteriaceae bacterium]|nr:hypothetical protein [Flavobacteriaceae bacterium]
MNLMIYLMDFQCAMCRAVLESGADQRTAESLNDGIVYLMVIPYILVAVTLYFLYSKFFKK